MLVAVFVALFIYRCYKYCFYRPPNFPPGPPRLPFVGSYLFLLLVDYRNKHLAIHKLCKYYKTSVLGFYTGPIPTVVANDPKSVREVLFRQDYDGRLDIPLARLREPNFNLKGIFFLDGGYWLHQRRFTLRNLRDFGFGRRHQDYEEEVIDEMKKLVELIRDGPKYEHEKKYFTKDGRVNLPKALIGALGNCFLQACAGERLSRADQYKIFEYIALNNSFLISLTLALLSPTGQVRARSSFKFIPTNTETCSGCFHGLASSSLKHLPTGRCGLLR